MSGADQLEPKELSVEEAIVAAQDEAPSAPAADALEGPARIPSSGAYGAALVTAGIVLSRLVGLVRQRMVAHFFGTSAFADVIAAAFRVGNITQNLLGEGTLSASFVPVYAKLRAQKKIEESRKFALSALGLLGVVVVVASALGVVFARQLTVVIAGGFDEARLDATARVVRVLFPMTGVLVLSVWGLGVLNAHGRLFLGYAAPVMWSLAQIAGLYLFGTWLHQRGEPLAMVLAYSALAGAALQLLVMLPAARALLGRLTPSFDTKDPNVREAAKQLPAVLVGRGVIQISGLVDTLLVSFLGQGANASFGYAQTIYLLPMSLLGTGEAAAALPEMAADDAETDKKLRNKAIRERLGASLSRIAVLSVPTTLAFVLLGKELVRVLFQTGSFDDAAVMRVEPLLAAYGFALFANAAGRVLTSTAWAIGEAKLAATYSVVRVVASALGAFVLMRYFDVMGVVLGAVIAAWVETIALAWKIRPKIDGLGLEKIPVAKVTLLGALTIAPSVAARYLLPASLIASRLGALGVLALACAAFAIAAPALKLFDVRSLLRRRKR